MKVVREAGVLLRLDRLLGGWVVAARGVMFRLLNIYRKGDVLTLSGSLGTDSVCGDAQGAEVPVYRASGTGGVCINSFLNFLYVKDTRGPATLLSVRIACFQVLCEATDIMYMDPFDNVYLRVVLALFLEVNSITLSSPKLAQNMKLSGSMQLSSSACMGTPEFPFAKRVIRQV